MPLRDDTRRGVVDVKFANVSVDKSRHASVDLSLPKPRLKNTRRQGCDGSKTPPIHKSSQNDTAGGIGWLPTMNVDADRSWILQVAGSSGASCSMFVLIDSRNAD